MPALQHTPEDVALSLTLVVVASSPEPLLLLDGDLTIIAASRSFCDAFRGGREYAAGHHLYALHGGDWDVPQLRSLLATTVSNETRTDDCEMELRRPGNPVRRLIVQARRLDYLDLDQIRVLVALTDVTNARADKAAREEALRHNEVLLQEVRHRVANSLQIIASVLLQNARTTLSEETRGHLQNAHHRVMSVAALERVLSTSEEGDVDVHAYFTSLCESITDSMIGDADNISLRVDGGQGVIEARVSVSLGLIVTELVINALKYAFPDGRPGKIAIDYNFHGPNWVLCVRDDGVGMPADGATVRTGLGTNIVRALAAQLSASVAFLPEQPGTKVTIEHTQIALVQGETETAPELLTARQAPAERQQTGGGRP